MTDANGMLHVALMPDVDSACRASRRVLFGRVEPSESQLAPPSGMGHFRKREASSRSQDWPGTQALVKARACKCYEYNDAGR